jgi:hypothetical protein
MRGEGGDPGSQPMSTGVHSSPNNFEDLTPYLTRPERDRIKSTEVVYTPIYLYTCMTL